MYRFHVSGVDVALEKLAPIIADLLNEIPRFEHGVVCEVGLCSRIGHDEQIDEDFEFGCDQHRISIFLCLEDGKEFIDSSKNS